MCEVEYTDQFETWWDHLDEDEQESVASVVGVLAEEGATLRHPYSSGIKASRHSHMRELRVQHAGDPYRVLYAFDPRRTAILLIGGCKTGDERFYEKLVPLADQLYDKHLNEIMRSSTAPQRGNRKQK